MVTVMWPMPSEAEQWASRISVGMTWEQVKNTVPDFAEPRASTVPISLTGPFHRNFDDGSFLHVTLDEPSGRVESIRTTPPPPVHPLTHLRRNLARIFPALGE
jgi:hypothetical protein